MGHLCQGRGAHTAPVEGFETHPCVSASAFGVFLASCAALLLHPSAPTSPAVPMTSLCWLVMGGGQGGEGGSGVRVQAPVHRGCPGGGRCSALQREKLREAANPKWRALMVALPSSSPAPAARQGMLPCSDTSTRTVCSLPPCSLSPCRAAGQAELPGKGWALVPTPVQGVLMGRLVPRCHFCPSHPISPALHAAQLGVGDPAHPSNGTTVSPALRETSPRVGRVQVWVKVWGFLLCQSPDLLHPRVHPSPGPGCAGCCAGP